MSALDFLKVRLRQGTRTAPFPPEAGVLPERFRGRPVFDAGKCTDGCRDCVARVPSGVMRVSASGSIEVDVGASLFSPDEAAACPAGALGFSSDYRTASITRDGLVSPTGTVALAAALDAASRRLFGRALRLRQVSAGGCNGCEAELVALGNVVFDLARFGVQFVASPRHADGLVITGTVNANMVGALRDAWEATPEPRIVVAVGACAINGGPFRGSTEAGTGVPADIPVDLWVPGCPPHPLTVMDGLLRLLGRVEAGQR
ncbi:MAG: hydrogenase [Gemmatimonadales bacterium]